MAALRQMLVLPCDADEYVAIMREMDAAFRDHLEAKGGKEKAPPQRGR